MSHYSYYLPVNSYSNHAQGTYSYTSYWQVGEFLMNSDRQFSYSLKFAPQTPKDFDILMYLLDWSSHHSQAFTLLFTNELIYVSFFFSEMALVFTKKAQGQLCDRKFQ